jgi:hypothetical protein
MAVNGCSCREPFCPKCWPAPTASSEMSRLMDKCVELTAENQRLREDQQQVGVAGAAGSIGLPCFWYVGRLVRRGIPRFGAWVWGWREAIDVAMEDSND